MENTKVTWWNRGSVLNKEQAMEALADLLTSPDMGSDYLSEAELYAAQWSIPFDRILALKLINKARGTEDMDWDDWSASSNDNWC